MNPGCSVSGLYSQIPVISMWEAWGVIKLMIMPAEKNGYRNIKWLRPISALTPREPSLALQDLPCESKSIPTMKEMSPLRNPPFNCSYSSHCGTTPVPETKLDKPSTDSGFIMILILKSHSPLKSLWKLSRKWPSY